MKVVLITGLSGAGKTTAADWFEDQGYYCIDNMPPQLVRRFLDLLDPKVNRIEKVALVVDVRTGNFFEEFDRCIDDLRQTDNVESAVLYVEASTEAIVKRYSETRRSHPLTGGRATASVIEEETALLREVRQKADFIIDTTGIKGAALENELSRIFLGNEGGSFSVNITSFGFKYGIPSESDLVFDMRFIPNPYYVASLRKLTGNNQKVRHYVLKHEITQQFIESVDTMVNELIPGYVNEGKYHLNIAFGCTGGHHRSVAVANEVARRFREQGKLVTVTHRDLDFIQKRR